MSGALSIPLPPSLREILTDTPELADALLVGGPVRDALAGQPPLDLDFEVRGVPLDALAAALVRHGATDLVGRSFGVVKLRLPEGAWVDFSIPRRDSKTGPGHRGFEVVFDPSLAPREAAARRDFTLNAMAWNPRTGELLDPFGGREDLARRVLRHTSEAFPEDPLRVLRGLQLAARFELTADPATLALCRELKAHYPELAIERVRAEWWKFATRARRPSRGLVFLRDSGWLEHYPELAALAGLEQDPAWHPEGDVWTHTLHTLDALVACPQWLAADDDGRAVLTFAALTHDLGKAVTTRREVRDGRERIISPGHDQESVPLAARMLERMGQTAAITARVLPLVAAHMAHLAPPTPRAVRRLARRLAPETVSRLAVLIAADAAGRPPLPPGPPEGLGRLLSAAADLRLADEAPRPILQGRHLVERGWSPGPEVGRLLERAFEAQLDGDFGDLEGALAWFERHSGRPRA